MNPDPLFLCNPKLACPDCGGGRKQRRGCPACRGSGFARISLAGLWSPAAAFLVCGGPSLNRFRYERLADRGIASLAINNAAGLVPCRAWTFGDPQSKFHHGLFMDPAVLTFAPTGKLRKRPRVKLPDGTFRTLDVEVRNCPGTVGYSRTGKFDAATFLTDWTAHWGHGGGSGKDRPFTLLETMLLGLRLLHYLGCPRVYLLGVDFHMPKVGGQYAFGQSKKARNRRYGKANRLLAELRPVFDAAGFTVYNCNSESQCTAFEHRTFDDALTDCRGLVPTREPWDLSEWYNKGVERAGRERWPDPVDIESAKAMAEG